MKPRNDFFALLGFNLRLLPQNVWFLVFIYCLNSLIFGIIAYQFRSVPWGGERGIISSTDILPIMFCGILAMQFFITAPGWSGVVGLMPGGEFLFVRPVHRRTAYLSRMLLYFVIILVAPLLKVVATTADPDLRISLQQNKNSGTEVADKLSLYRNQFPHSSMIRTPHGTHDMLVIPNGTTLIAVWELWLALLLALALQLTTLLPLPTKIQMSLLMAIAIGPIFGITFNVFGEQEAIMENVFFAFVHHGCLVALLTLGAVVLVQRFALQRIQDWEVL